MRTEHHLAWVRMLILMLVGGVLGITMIQMKPAIAAVSSKDADTDPSDGVRTLEAIQIEGVIAIPQVLFITSRDHPRFRDGLRERYRETALEIGRGASFPHRFKPLTEHPQPQK